VPGTRSVAVGSIQPTGQVGPDMPVFRLELRVERDGSPSNWNDGLNVLWVLARKEATGWTIGEVASSPISVAGQTGPRTPAATNGYQRISARDVGIVFEVPIGWIKDGPGQLYRPAAGSPVSVGVAFDRTSDPTALLPKGAEVLAKDPLELGWGKGTTYTLRRAGGPAREVHVVVPLGSGAAYDLFSTASADPASAQLADAAMQHMLRSVVLVGG
jgi:hypothetical protein